MTFDLKDDFAQGSFGRIMLVKGLVDQNLYVVKEVDISELDDQSLELAKKEIFVMVKLRNESKHIVEWVVTIFNLEVGKATKATKSN